MTTAAQEANLKMLMDQAGTPVTTAFVIYQTPDGQWAANADFADQNFDMDRKATLDDIIGGSAAVQLGCTAQQTAMTTLFMMEQQMQAKMAAMQQQQEAQKVASLIDPSKLRSPRA